MARCLIIGCGCRSQALARELRAQGHAVRGTSRDPARLGAIATTGAEAVLADPDRVATLAPALAQVTILCLLLGSATGPPEAVAELHGTRLEMLLEKARDTTVRGVLYESVGSVEASVLAGGAQRVRSACEDSRVPFALIDSDPADPVPWVRDVATAVNGLLSA